MSMYEMVFADGENGLPLLGSLGFTSVSDVGRYRSAWIEKGENGNPRIAVYTRNGGGNRETYQPILNKLEKHKNYLFDRDDSFDCTYCTIYFSIPEKLKITLNKIDKDWEKNIQDSVDMSGVWLKTIDSMKGGS